MIIRISTRYIRIHESIPPITVSNIVDNQDKSFPKLGEEPDLLIRYQFGASEGILVASITTYMSLILSSFYATTHSPPPIL